MNDQINLGFESELDAKFREYHADNPHIFRKFTSVTFAAIERGHKHFGAQSIIEIMRWQSPVTADDPEGFKINNNYGSYYSRLFEAKYPQYKGFFRKRAKRAH